MPNTPAKSGGFSTPIRGQQQQQQQQQRHLALRWPDPYMGPFDGGHLFVSSGYETEPTPQRTHSGGVLLFLSQPALSRCHPTAAARRPILSVCWIDFWSTQRNLRETSLWTILLKKASVLQSWERQATPDEPARVTRFADFFLSAIPAKSLKRKISLTVEQVWGGVVVDIIIENRKRKNNEALA